MRALFYMAGAIMAVAPVAAKADDITISPRAWLLFDNLSTGEEVGTNGAGLTASVTSPPFVVFMKGASIGYRSDSFLPNTSFTATAMFGSDKKTLTVRGGGIFNVAGPNNTLAQQLFLSVEQTPQRLRRSDFELTAQTRINDLLSWTLGLRYERARVEFTPVVTNSSSNAFTNLVDVQRVTFSPFKGGYDLYSVRGGVAMAAPLNEARNDLLYANAMAFAGQRINLDSIAASRYNDATFIGPDITVGYSHRFSPNLAFDARYRGQFFYTVAGHGQLGSPKTTHGPSIGLSYTF